HENLVGGVRAVRAGPGSCPRASAARVTVTLATGATRRRARVRRHGSGCRLSGAASALRVARHASGTAMCGADAVDPETAARIPPGLPRVVRRLVAARIAVPERVVERERVAIERQ